MASFLTKILGTSFRRAPVLAFLVVSAAISAQPPSKKNVIDLNGFWMDNGRAVRIVQSGVDVTAFYVDPYVCEYRDKAGGKSRTNINFTATLYGNKLIGETNVCYYGPSNEHGVGLKLAKMELTVNADGSELQGTWKGVGDYSGSITLTRQTLKITGLALKDIDNTTLEYLSVAEHSYCRGNTQVHGTITIEGADGDELSSVVLEVLEWPVIDGTAVKATGKLAKDAEKSLLKPFGAAKMVSIRKSQLLFELPSAEFGKVDQTKNGTVLLRVKATSKMGQKVTKDFGAVGKLVRYTGKNRYGPRDNGRGGDDWVKPSVKKVAEHFVGINWNDFSNMNGGSFAPDHKSHRTGNDIDGKFNGYSARDAATAQTMINYLNDPTFGSRITNVFVTFRNAQGNVTHMAFWNAIKDVTLNDGRRAQDVITSVADHDTHFHWRISD